MTSIGLIGAGAMGSALGACWSAGGAEVRTCLAGRSERTRTLATRAGIADVPDLDTLVQCDLVVSVVPPARARAVAAAVAGAARRTGAVPLVADLNAISPPSVHAIARELTAAGLELVDGSISGPPPAPGAASTIVYLSGPRAGDVAELAAPWVRAHRLAGPLGSASALKMCTASLYKGSTALVAQAMLTARRHGVLEEFLDDTARAWPANRGDWPREVALAATKSARFVDEMCEIARTQQTAGGTPALFEGIAATYARIATTELGHRAPESVRADEPVDAVLQAITLPQAELPAAVLFDFSGTLFHIESAAVSLLRALGPEAVPLAAAVQRHGGINGAGTPAELPADLADVWSRRDLSRDAHREAYSTLSMRAGLDRAKADRLYEHGIGADAWHPFPDTVAVLRSLHALRVPVAVVSNIGWDPRPVLARYGVDGDIDELVLSYEVGVEKPDAEIFRIACHRLGAAPEDAVMIGDNAVNDGGSRTIGIPFVPVTDDPGTRGADELTRAVPGLVAVLAAGARR